MHQEFFQHSGLHVICHCREEAKDSSRLLMPILLPACERWLSSMRKQRSLTQLAERLRRAIYADRIWYDSLEKSHASGLSVFASSCSLSPCAGSSSSFSISTSIAGGESKTLAAQKHFPI